MPLFVCPHNPVSAGFLFAYSRSLDMKRHLAYLRYVLRHKWFVFVACLGLRVPIWNAIFHDWHKFTPGEWFPYARAFYKPDGSGQYKPDSEFDLAWNAHQKRGKHHWQYWLLSPDKPRPNFNMQSYDGAMTHVYIRRITDGANVAIVYDDSIGIHWPRPPFELEEELRLDLFNTPQTLPMPDWARREMMADWIGAGRALGKPKTWEWYEANKGNIFIHPETRAWIEHRLVEMKTYHAQYEKMRGMGIIT